MISPRAGLTLAEALVALLLGSFLVHLGLTTITRIRAERRIVTERLDVLAATRIARSVLRRELARGDPKRDVTPTPDSIRLRAFRGTGLVCSMGPANDEVVLMVRGDRQPEPAKDSVEVTTSDGSTAYRDLLGVGSAPRAGCPDVEAGEDVQRWRTDGPLPAGPVAVRFFETGSYHLGGDALRYRVGAGGRQPLTPSAWIRSAFVLGDSTLAIRLETRRGVRTGTLEFVAWTR